MFDIKKITGTAEIEVLVKFPTESGAVEGSYFATVRRPTQADLDELADPEAGFTNSEVLDKYFTRVRGIGSDGTELSADEQLAYVKSSPECVSAGAVAFLKAFGPERYAGKTSKKRR